jgi:hypothetical protein
MNVVRFALAATSLLGPVALAQVTVTRPVPQSINQATIAADSSDAISVAEGPVTLSGPSLAAKMGALGLRPDEVSADEPLKLTVVRPRSSLGNLSMNDVSTTSTLDANGWALVRGQVMVRFNALAGSRYLVDFSVGDILAGKTGSRHLTARIYDGSGTSKGQEFTIPKGSEHVVLLVEARGTRPSVVLAAGKDDALSSGMQAVGGSISQSSGSSLSTTPGTLATNAFVFYSAEITKLK